MELPVALEVRICRVEVPFGRYGQKRQGEDHRFEQFYAVVQTSPPLQQLPLYAILDDTMLLTPSLPLFATD